MTGKIKKKQFSAEKIVAVLIEKTLNGSLKWRIEKEKYDLAAKKGAYTFRISLGGPDLYCLTVRKKNDEIYRCIVEAQIYGLFPKMRRLTVLAKNTVFEKEILLALKK